MPKYKTMKVPVYKISDTVWNMIKQMLIVGAVAMGTFFVNLGAPELISSYPEYAAIIIAVSAVITGIIHWYNHKDDTQEVTINTETGEIVK